MNNFLKNLLLILTIIYLIFFSFLFCKRIYFNMYIKMSEIFFLQFKVNLQKESFFIFFLSLTQIFEMENMMDLHVLRSPESVKHIFRGWSVCVCVSVISLTQKQITAETSNSASHVDAAWNFLWILAKKLKKGT